MVQHHREALQQAVHREAQPGEAPHRAQRPQRTERADAADGLELRGRGSLTVTVGSVGRARAGWVGWGADLRHGVGEQRGVAGNDDAAVDAVPAVALRAGRVRIGDAVFSTTTQPAHSLLKIRRFVKYRGGPSTSSCGQRRRGRLALEPSRPARAGNRRLGRLSAPRAHPTAPDETDLLWRTRRGA
jgi:hypothetical protein